MSREVVQAAEKLVEHILRKEHLHYNDDVLEQLTSDLEDALLAQHSQPSTPGPDPRVREVMAAAARVIEAWATFPGIVPGGSLTDLKEALFAAQHSRSKLDGPEPQLANFCKVCGHIAWLVHLKDGLCLDCQDAAQQSEPTHICVEYPRAKSILTCCVRREDIPSLTLQAYCVEEKGFLWHLLRGTGLKNIFHVKTAEGYEELFGEGSCRGKVLKEFERLTLEQEKPKAQCVKGPNGVVIHADPSCPVGTFRIAEYGDMCPTCGERI